VNKLNTAKKQIVVVNNVLQGAQVVNLPKNNSDIFVNVIVNLVFMF
jgi:hypothetical protein